jgi:hypothetical protein
MFEFYGVGYFKNDIIIGLGFGYIPRFVMPVRGKSLEGAMEGFSW